ncbi:hypothetical protein D3C81_1853070 [compost metagenome]
MSRDAKDTVYCSIQMPMSQGKTFLELITALRVSGAHESLDSVFAEIQGEQPWSIKSRK